VHIDLRNVYKEYKLGKVNIPALKGINFVIEEGSFISIMGPSGSGKSTLLNLLGLIDYPSTGEIFFDKTLLNFKNDSELTKLRRENIGFIFQHFNLIPILNVMENIEFPILNTSIPLKERRRRMFKILQETGLTGLEKRMPNEISGGQQQRVAIGRALIGNPKIIIADEPTANLDSATAKKIVEILHNISKEEKTTVIMATHDPEIISLSERVIKIHDGQIAGD